MRWAIAKIWGLRRRRGKPAVAGAGPASGDGLLLSSDGTSFFKLVSGDFLLLSA